MMKSGNRLIFSILVFGIVLFSLMIVPVTAAKLATPVLASPPNNQHYYHPSLVVYLTWKRVPDATTYTIEIERKVGALWNPEPSLSSKYTYTSFTATLDQIYRWRVTAYDTIPADGTHDPSTPSAWRTFDLLSVGSQLPTPIMTSPPAGTDFYSPFVAQLVWKPVQGADNYIVNVERYDTVSKSWVFQLWGIHDSEFDTEEEFLSIWSPSPPQQFRWRVTAVDPDGHWLSSKPTAWRSFNYKV